MEEKFWYKSFKNTKLYIAVIVITSITSAYLTSLIPLFVKYAIDSVIYKNTETFPQYMQNFLNNSSLEKQLIIICIFLFLINLLLAISNYIKNKSISKFNVKLNQNVKKEIMQKTIDLQYKTFNNYSNSEIMQTVNGDTNVYTSFFDTSLILIIQALFTAVFSIYNIFTLNITIGIYVIITIILMIIASVIYYKKNTILANRTIEANEKIIKYTNSFIRNIKMIKMYGKEQERTNSFYDIVNNYKKNNFEYFMSLNRYNGFCHTINILKGAVVITIGGIYITIGKLTFGSLTALLKFATNAIENSRDVTIKFADIGKFKVSYKRLTNYLNLPVDKQSKNMKLSGDIRFSNVSIYINDYKKLKNISFTIEQGKSYALVGDNGVGKSILLKTILGAYKYTGDIYIGNANLKELEPDAIIQNIGFVDQQEFLFNTTIKENICLGGKTSSLIEIAKDCEIYDDIINFEDRFNTIVNDNLNLSGGQKQRISIARSLFQNKAYYLFDDCFNKLDSLTKAKIIDMILSKKTTNIIATHDFQIISNIKNVLFINNGTIISDHHEVLEKENEFYKKLINVDRNILGDEYA